MKAIKDEKLLLPTLLKKPNGEQKKDNILGKLAYNICRCDCVYVVRILFLFFFSFILHMVHNKYSSLELAKVTRSKWINWP